MSAPFVHRNLPRLLLQARESVMLHFRPDLRAYGLTDQQWRVLRVLGEQPGGKAGVDTGQVAREAFILGPSLTGVLSRMERDGLIQRRRAPEDQRRTVVDATAKGATVVCGGTTVGDMGYFFAPTLLTEVSPDALVMHEEIFGPVAPVATFATEAEAITRANDTEYGLVAYVFTKDLARTLRVSEALEFGMVGINQGIVSNPAAPFGGVKHSGFGREGGFEGIEEYLEVKYVGIAP